MMCLRLSSWRERGNAKGATPLTHKFAERARRRRSRATASPRPRRAAAGPRLFALAREGRRAALEAVVPCRATAAGISSRAERRGARSLSRTRPSHAPSSRGSPARQTRRLEPRSGLQWRTVGPTPVVSAVAWSCLKLDHRGGGALDTCERGTGGIDCCEGSHDLLSGRLRSIAASTERLPRCCAAGGDAAHKIEQDLQCF